MPNRARSNNANPLADSLLGERSLSLSLSNFKQSSKKFQEMVQVENKFLRTFKLLS